ncbi:MAG: hypothetical protein KGJ89_04480 [Patescibacteria group bacterium]|nr:hypothetical protein [Patescibacteria group bacterium]MDE2015808.1 hypothetical protein [Patescibacteria group bacterium]MDE2227183.1 hypothetical protein [Patescibacteria group bacterium]
MKEHLSKKIVIIYHGDCPDGFGAAWAAWKKFGARAAYIPVAHHDSSPAGLKNKEIYFLDFVYSANVMAQLMRNNKRVTAIDHHVSAEKVTKMTQDWIYAVHNSGAVLSWKYFHPKKSVPMLLRCIEDRDIWKWRTKNSKKILAIIDLFERKFSVWDKLAKTLENRNVNLDFARKGELLLKHDAMLMQKLLNSADKVKFSGKIVYALNAPRYFADDLGQVLSRKLSPFAIVWREENGLMRVSLRANGKADVSKIAKRFGGGGHKNASGFSFPVGRKLPWSLIRK